MDETIREAERLASSSGDPSDEAQALVARQRAGQLEPARLKLAAFFDHPAARVALDLGAPDAWARKDPDAWVGALRPAGQAWLVSAGQAATHVLLRRWAAWFPTSGQPARALEAIDAWLACPCDDHLARVTTTGEAARLEGERVRGAEVDLRRDLVRTPSLDGLSPERVRFLARLGHEGARARTGEGLAAPSDLGALEAWLRDLATFEASLGPEVWREAADAATGSRKDDPRSEREDWRLRLRGTTPEQRWPSFEAALAAILEAARSRDHRTERLGGVPLTIARALRPLALGSSPATTKIRDNEWNACVVKTNAGLAAAVTAEIAAASSAIAAGARLHGLLTDLVTGGRQDEVWQEVQARVVPRALEAESQPQPPR